MLSYKTATKQQYTKGIKAAGFCFRTTIPIRLIWTLTLHDICGNYPEMWAWQGLGRKDAFTSFWVLKGSRLRVSWGAVFRKKCILCVCVVFIINYWKQFVCVLARARWISCQAQARALFIHTIWVTQKQSDALLLFTHLYWLISIV